VLTVGIGAVTRSSSSGAVVNATTYVLNVRFSPTEVSAYLNGTQVIAPISYTFTGRSADAAYLGARTFAGPAAVWTNGREGDFIRTDAALTTDERTALHAYLSAKWGVTINP